VRGRLQKTHCRAGHELKPETIYRDPLGRRVCKECRRRLDQRRDACSRRRHPVSDAI
jgi:hypothetical protein